MPEFSDLAALRLMIRPPALQPGDKVAITCPAKKLPHPIPEAVALLESWGLQVVLGETVDASWNQFAGTDELRARDFQQFLDDDSISAIFAARGGYGTIRIIDRLDFTRFNVHPKWVVGFSDITVLHSHIFANFGLPSIHGQMPMTVPDASKPSLESLRKALFGEPLQYRYTTTIPNRPGKAEGILLGGNLTLVMMMEGSLSEADLDGAILFLEDVGEYLYSIDRMMRHLFRAGKLSKLKGLIVGGFTGMKEQDIPFGQSAEQIIAEVVQAYDYPVAYQFPAGHIDDNRALVLGTQVVMDVREWGVEVRWM